LDKKRIKKHETIKRNKIWCENILKNTTENIKKLKNRGIKTKINFVVNKYQDIKEIKEIKKYVGDEVELRLLNNLSSAKKTDKIIKKIIKDLHGIEKSSYKRKSSSSKTIYYNTQIGELSIKKSSTFYFNDLCNNCPIKNSCYEGFYGIRVEKRKRKHYIRLCLYRNDKEVLMTYQKFLKSKLKNKYLILK
jgi:MoaA/NifB/PqqE/SkfB family radical SAM enzyme